MWSIGMNTTLGLFLEPPPPQGFGFSGLNVALIFLGPMVRATISLSDNKKHLAENTSRWLQLLVNYSVNGSTTLSPTGISGNLTACTSPKFVSGQPGYPLLF